MLIFFSNLGFEDLGCWIDDRDYPAVPISLQGHCDLTGRYQDIPDVINKCYQCANGRGNTLFAIQDGGKCWTGPDDEGYKKYGASTDCLPDGRGGPLANQVYKMKGKIKRDRYQLGIRS